MSNLYTDIDPRINHALDTIKGTYGDRCSVETKRKGLLKFGRNETVGTTQTTVMTLPGTELSETFVSDNLITHVASADNSDVVELVIEGHTITDGLLTFSTQRVTLAGQTKTALTTPVARVTRAYNDGAVDLVGPVYVAQNVTFTAGVPQTDSAIHLIIPAANNQSRKCSTSLSSTDYWILTNVYCDVLEKTAAYVDAQLQVRQIGKVFRTQVTFSASSTGRGIVQFEPYLIVPKNSDVQLMAIASNANTDVSGGIQGYLAGVIE